MDFLTLLDDAINRALAGGASREDILSELELKVMGFREELEGEE